MTSEFDPTRCEVLEGQWPAEPSVHRNICPLALKGEQRSLRKRAAHGLARFLTIFCMGIFATLAWQSYGDAAKEMLASSYPLLGWLAPQTAVAETAPDAVSPTAPATISESQEELRSILVNLAVVRQTVDQLAAQFVAGQQQTAGDIAKLNEKISSAPPRQQAAAAPARKPAPVPSPQLSEASPAR